MTIDQRIKEQTIKFGEVNKTRVIDGDGSTATTQVIYADGTPNMPQRVRYEFRTRVKNITEEQQEYDSFSNEVAYNLKMLDPVFKLERTKRSLENGYYYVVKAYTVLEY